MNKYQRYIKILKQVQEQDYIYMICQEIDIARGAVKNKRHLKIWIRDQLELWEDGHRSKFGILELWMPAHHSDTSLRMTVQDYSDARHQWIDAMIEQLEEWSSEENKY